MASLLIGFRQITSSLNYINHVRVTLPTIASVLENKCDHIGTLFNASLYFLATVYSFLSCVHFVFGTLKLWS